MPPKTAKEGPRAKNWSELENSVLVELLTTPECVINKKFSTTVRQETREKFWMDVTEQVNDVGGHNRTKEQIYKKWCDLKRETKKLECKRRKAASATGGGPPPKQLSALHEKIAGIIPQCCIDGLDGGVDTFNVTGKSRESFLSRTDEELRFDQAIRETIAANTVETHDQMCQEESSKMTGSGDNCVEKNTLMKTQSYQSKRKRANQRDHTDSIMDLEQEKLEVLHSIKDVLVNINNHIIELVQMKRKSKDDLDPTIAGFVSSVLDNI